MRARQTDNANAMAEAVQLIGAQVVQRQANCAVQYRYLADRADMSTTLEYVALHYGWLGSCECICRRLSVLFLRVGAWLTKTADVLAATDERRQRAGYER